MNNHQRAVYQPMMENVPIYDLADDDVEEERSRLPLIIVIALLVLAAFAGVVWLAYNQGVARGRAGAQIVVAAPEGPVRTAPADAGDATPFTRLKVYSQPLPPDVEAQSSSLAPDSAPPATALDLAQQAAPAPATTETPPFRLDPRTQAAPAPAPPAVAPAPAAPKPAPIAQAPAPAAAPARPAPAPAAAPKTAVAAATAGTALLQIGAYESEEIANGAWSAFQSRFGGVVGQMSENVQKVDLGAKGTWYRVRVGPFADRAAAITACEKIKAGGGTCFIAAP